MKRNNDIREVQLKIHELYDNNYIPWSVVREINAKLQEFKIPLVET